MKTPAQFWAAVRQGTEDACWPWLRSQAGRGSKEGKGYGQLKWQGARAYAHRVAFELAKGCIPADKLVMHTCDNPTCCNPKHLMLGDYLENMRDMARKGRSRGAGPRGAANGHAVLTDEQVREIRMAYVEAEYQDDKTVSQRSLAKKYGVSKSQIGNILNYSQRSRKDV